MNRLISSAAEHAGNVLDSLPGIALPGGICGAIAVIIVTLIKFRSTDRTNLSEETQSHMDRLTTERNDAVDAENAALKSKREVEQVLEQERRSRWKAEDNAANALRHSNQLQAQVAELTEQVRRLTSNLNELNHKLTNGQATASGGD